MTSDIVFFEMPDGTKVTNDQRHVDLLEQREEVLNAVPNRGDVGITQAEQEAQTQVVHQATLNSGQPGVGPNAVPSDPQEYIGNLGTPAMQRQEEDRKKAEEAGADMTSTSVKDADPVDSNKAVQEVRDAKEAAREELQKALEKLGEGEPGDPDVAYSEWNQKQLKLEVARRNAEREVEDQIDISGFTKKSQLADALDADDEANPEGPADSTTSTTGD